PAHLEARHVGQLDVENDELRRLLRGDAERLAPGGRLANGEAEAAQELSAGEPARLVVVDVEDRDPFHLTLMASGARRRPALTGCRRRSRRAGCPSRRWRPPGPRAGGA